MYLTDQNRPDGLASGRLAPSIVLHSLISLNQLPIVMPTWLLGPVAEETLI